MDTLQGRIVKCSFTTQSREDALCVVSFLVREHDAQPGLFSYLSFFLCSGLTFFFICLPSIPCTTFSFLSRTSLKWKPPSENSIDFKLELRFPPAPRAGGEEEAIIDYTAMPVFKLYQWLGGEEYEFFDAMDIEEEVWEELVGSFSLLTK